MTGSVVRRLVALPLTVFAALSLLFVLFFVLPGDPVQLIAGGYDRSVDDATRDRIEQRYDLDEPLPEQFVGYWSRTLRGELGESYVDRRDVNDLVRDRGMASLRLAFWAIVLEVVLAIGVGVWAAAHRGSWGDRLSRLGTAVAVAVPVFVLGYLLQFLFAVLPARWDWPASLRLRTGGIGPDTWVLGVIPTGDQWRHLVLPVVTLAGVSSALAIRLMRSSMLDTLSAPFIRTARAAGLSERRVVYGRALRNALLPVVTVLGTDFGAMLGASVLTEKVFSWPGIGSAVADAVAERDMPAMLGLTLVVVVAYGLVNLAVDLAYRALDPRVRG